MSCGKRHGSPGPERTGLGAITLFVVTVLLAVYSTNWLAQPGLTSFDDEPLATASFEAPRMVLGAVLVLEDSNQTAVLLDVGLALVSGPQTGLGDVRVVVHVGQHTAVYSYGGVPGNTYTLHPMQDADGSVVHGVMGPGDRVVLRLALERSWADDARSAGIPVAIEVMQATEDLASLRLVLPDGPSGEVRA